MSTKPLDSVFGVPERPDDEGSSAREPSLQTPMSHAASPPDGSYLEGAPGADPPGAEVEWTSSELHSIATTIEDLQRRLEAANTRLSTAATVETTESEIGRLFVEAQRFSEESLSKLESQINEILRAAEDKAREILSEATQEALEIRRHAQEAAFLSARTTQELQTAIAGFTEVNNELVKELGALNSMLTPGTETGGTEPHQLLNSPEGD